MQWVSHLTEGLANLSIKTVLIAVGAILLALSLSRLSAQGKDRTAAWRNWMLDGATPGKAMGQCDLGALARNSEFGRKYRINGTPGIVFEDGKRSPGAMNAEQLEKQLVASRAAAPRP